MTGHRRAVAILACASFLGPLPAAAQTFSPGPLARVHAPWDADDQCVKCHSAGAGVADSACIACHTRIGADRQTRHGLHGVGYAGRHCASCHVDHHGRSAPLIRWPGGGPAKLDHALTGWPLRGEHVGLECRACHGATQGPSGFRAPRTCGGCHDDPHGGRFGALCQSCHSESGWERVSLASFDHSATRFALVGSHRETACSRCHGNPPRYAGLAFESCASCHRSPHQSAPPDSCAGCHLPTSWSDMVSPRGQHPTPRLTGGHAEVPCQRCHDAGPGRAPSRGSSCVSCHASVHEADFGTACASCHRETRWQDVPEPVARSAHARTPFPLQGRHARVACDACHDPARPPEARYRRLRHTRCTGCHEDRHDGLFADRDRGNCDPCHDPTGFSPTTFGPTQHATTEFPLNAAHRATPCSGCHPRTEAGMTLSLTDRRCEACHGDPHDGQFAAQMGQGGCVGCHGDVGGERGAVDHAGWPLTGAHEAVACASCHPASSEAGRAPILRGTPRTCEGCHEDVHAGQFRLTEPSRTCEGCHDTTTFRVAGFEHAERSAFALDGRHRSLACARCHPTEELRNGARAVRFRLGYGACADCHASPHGAAGAGRDGATDGLDCARCHGTAGWGLSANGARLTGFDHGRTGFPLAGRHRAAACLSCHVSGRPASRACPSCHEDPHEHRVSDACDGCHAPSSWADTRAHDRHRRTRLPLTGAHAVASCDACHLRRSGQTWASVPTSCASCHLRDSPHGTALGTACASCHGTTGWSPASTGATGQALVAVVHDGRFDLRSGAHRRAPCASCHVGEPGRGAAECAGCHAHAPARMRSVHGRDVGSRAGACLACHPGGMAR